MQNDKAKFKNESNNLLKEVTESANIVVSTIITLKDRR
jgi:hypothetical protein